MQRLLLLIAAMCCATSFADDLRRSELSRGFSVGPVPKTIAGKRQWLREAVTQRLTSVQQIRQAHQLIDRATPRQLDELIARAQAQTRPDNAQQASVLQQTQQELLRAQALRRQLEYELMLRRQAGNVGYRPQITWLPEGTNLGASAGVSPDRRHVRINANPFFSSVGPVYTYNLGTGETRPWPYGQQAYPDYRAYPTPTYSAPRQTYPGYTNSPGFGQMPRQHLPPQTPSAQPNTWYDGVRTRVGPRPNSGR